MEALILFVSIGLIIFLFIKAVYEKMQMNKGKEHLVFASATIDEVHSIKRTGAHNLSYYEDEVWYTYCTEDGKAYRSYYTTTRHREAVPMKGDLIPIKYDRRDPTRCFSSAEEKDNDTMLYTMIFLIVIIAAIIIRTLLKAGIL